MPDCNYSDRLGKYWQFDSYPTQYDLSYSVCLDQFDQTAPKKVNGDPQSALNAVPAISRSTADVSSITVSCQGGTKSMVKQDTTVRLTGAFVVKCTAELVRHIVVAEIVVIG